MDNALYEKITTRSGGSCEAEVWTAGVWVRCNAPATDVHHMLTKARGGRNLDRVGEMYHLIHLCRTCHAQCDGASAYEGGMLIDGSCSWDKLKERPVYQGADLYLMRKYGRRAQERHTSG